jgi:hypothetical protein
VGDSPSGTTSVAANPLRIGAVAPWETPADLSQGAPSARLGCRASQAGNAFSRPRDPSTRKTSGLGERRFVPALRPPHQRRPGGNFLQHFGDSRGPEAATFALCPAPGRAAMSREPVWLELASFDPDTSSWRSRRLVLARAAMAAGPSLAIGSGVVLDVLVPDVAPEPLRFTGAVLSESGGHALVEGDLEASGSLIEALPELASYGFFALVPAAAFG